MVAPVITGASVQIVSTGTNALQTMNVPLSASGNDRILVVMCLAKDNTGTANLANKCTVDSAGVNRTLGSGVTLQGSGQIGQEGNFSSQCYTYFCLEADLPASSGTYAIDVGTDGTMQYNLWIAFEITGCPKQVYDNIVQNSGVDNVSAGVPFGDSITPVDDDCLIISAWATSHSASPTWTTSQTLVSSASNTNGAFIVSQFTQTTAASKTMTEESSSLHQRRAWNLISFSGVALGGGGATGKSNPLSGPFGGCLSGIM